MFDTEQTNECNREKNNNIRDTVENTFSINLIISYLSHFTVSMFPCASIASSEQRQKSF